MLLNLKFADSFHDQIRGISLIAMHVLRVVVYIYISYCVDKQTS